MVESKDTFSESRFTALSEHYVSAGVPTDFSYKVGEIVSTTVGNNGDLDINTTVLDATNTLKLNLLDGTECNLMVLVGSDAGDLNCMSAAGDDLCTVNYTAFAIPR
ncbi:MAG: hypothetical protein O3B64_01065 [bacterium]|nr:hypothetical protein [bacterium]